MKTNLLSLLVLLTDWRALYRVLSTFGSDKAAEVVEVSENTDLKCTCNVKAIEMCYTHR